MSKPTVKRKHISLFEEVEHAWNLLDGGVTATRIQWRAALEGRLSTGEYVDMSREAASAGEALVLLEEAIADSGWRIE
jgi:hypothetical protein